MERARSSLHIYRRGGTPVIDLELGKSDDVLRVERKLYHDRVYVDVRRWYQLDNGEHAPTAKGIMIPEDRARAVAEAIIQELESLKTE